MSNVVDRRVVEMQFDNRDFENNIQTSVQSLSKLKESLKLEESARELKAFEKTASKFSLDGMISAAESMTSKFSAMGTVGDQVLRRLTDSAMTAFYQMKRFVDSLTVDPIYTGFDEYNTQINSIQTILSNTREDLTSRGFDDAGRLGEVTAKLDELNSYADKTIYNFTEMTRNIGTFTAAGVDLYTAVDAIKGIANLAAVSGSTSEQASRAMYQLSQALSSGTVKLMDWNSVVNAGMGGKIFQDALTRTARAMKVTVDKTVTETNKRGKKVRKNVNMTVDQLIEKEGSFRESLSSGWLTADVLTATLEQFSWDFEEMARDEAVKMGQVLTDNLEQGINEQMEKKKIQLLAQGYTLDEAETIVQLARDAAEAATKVKTIPQLFDTLKEAAQSGWTKTWQFIIGDFEEAKETLSAIGDYFGRLIDISSDSRNAIMQQWHDNGGYASLWNNDEKKGPLGSFWNLVYGIKNIVSMIREEFQKVFPPATAQNLLDFTSSIQSATARFKEFTEESESFRKIRSIIIGVANAIDVVKQVLGGVYDATKQSIGYIFPFTNNILDFFVEVSERIVEFNKNLRDTEKIKFFVDGFVKVFKESVDILKLLFSDAEGIGDEEMGEWYSQILDIKQKLKELFDDNGFFSGINDFYVNIGTTIKNFLANVDGERIAKTIQMIFAIKSITSLWKFIKSLTEVREKLDGGVKGIVEEIIEGVIGKVKPWEQAQSISKTILKVAASFLMISGSIAIIAGALYAIAKIEPNKLVGSVFTLGLMIAAITGAAYALSKIKTKEAAGLILSSIGLKKLGDAVIVFTDALGRIGELDKNTLTQGIAGLGLVLLEIAAFMALTKTTKMGVFNGLGIILLSSSLVIFANAISKIGAINADSLIQGISGLGFVLLELTAFMALTNRSKFSVFKGAGLMLLGVAINVFINAIEKIDRLNTDSMIRGIAGLGLVFLELSAFMAMTSRVRFGLLKGAGLVMLSTSLMIFTDAISRISGIDTQTLIRGITGLGLVLIELAAFMALTKGLKFGFLKGTGLMMLGASLLLFVHSIDILGDLDNQSLVKGIAGLGAVLLELTLFMALTRKTGAGLRTGIGLMEIALSINMFASAISTLGNLHIESIIKGVTGLGLVMLEIATFLALTNHSKFGILKGTGLIMMAISLNVFAFSISQIGKLKTKSILKGVIGLGLIIIEIASLVKAMSKVKISAMLKSVVMFGVLGIALKGFVYAMDGIDGMNIDNILKFSASFGVAMLSMTKAISIIGTIPFTVMLVGIGKLALVAAATVTMLAAFGAAERAWSVSSYIESFGNLTESIGRAIGRFIGGLGSGIMHGVALPQAGTSLSDFMTNIQPFLNGCKGVDESVKTGIGNLADAMISISGAEFLTAISSWFTGENPISKFSDDIGLIAKMLNDFATSFSGFSADTSDIDKAVSVATSLTTLVKSVPWQAPEWAKAIAGSKNVEQFATDAKTLATALISYAETISGFDKTVNTKNTNNAKSVLEGLIELQNALPETDGWIQKLTGVQDLSDFAEKLPGFAKGLKAYGENINGFAKEVNPKDIKNSTSAASGLAELQNALPKTEGWTEKFTGIQDLSSFASKLPGFAEGMKAYAKEISGFEKNVTDSDVKNSTNAATALSNLANTIPASNGWIQAIIGEQNLGTFGEHCAQLGSGLASFASSIGGISTEQTQNALSAMSMIQTFTEGLNVEGGFLANIAEFFNGSKNITKLSGSMSTFGTDFQTFASGILGAGQAVTDFGFVKNVIESFISLSEAIKNGEIETWDLEYTANLLGNTFIDTTVSVITNGAERVKNSAIGIANDGFEAAEGTYFFWHRAGQNLGAGLANGIASMASTIRNRAVNAADGAIRAIQITWQVHSPSRVGFGLGKNFDLGLIGGMEQFGSRVALCAQGVGEQTVDSARTMLRGLDSSIFDNIDPNPTIRPVMDLTSIQNGVGMINGMFQSRQILGQGLFRGINAMNGLNRLSFDGSRIVGSMNNKDVVTELQSLRGRFDDLNRAVTNMKVVLDSGVLVGSTYTQMDDQLGVLAMRKGRGN